MERAHSAERARAQLAEVTLQVFKTTKVSKEVSSVCVRERFKIDLFGWYMEEMAFIESLLTPVFVIIGDRNCALLYAVSLKRTLEILIRRTLRLRHHACKQSLLLRKSTAVGFTIVIALYCECGIILKVLYRWKCCKE